MKHFRFVLAFVVNAICVLPPSWAGVNAWTTTGPRETWTFIGAHAIAPDRVFVSRAGATYRSADAGATWSPVTSAGVSAVCQASNAITAMTVSATDPNELYAAVGARLGCSGVIKSSDGGAHWSPVAGSVGQGTPSGGAFFQKIVHVAGSPAHLFAGERYLWVSSDGGATWRDASPAPGSVRDFAVDAGGSGTVYVLQLNKTFAKSADNGASWISLATNLPSDFSPLAIALDSADARHLYAVGTTSNGTGTARLYESRDGGVTWALRGSIAQLVPPLNIVTRLSIAADNPNVIHFVTSSAAWRSQDRGATWDKIVSPAGNAAAPEMLVTANIAYAGDLTYGLMRSDDGARTFEPRNGGLPGAIVDELGVGGASPMRYFARVAPDATGLAHQLAERDAATALWLDRTPPLGLLEGIGPKATEPVSGTTYAMTGARLQRSRDGGRTWEVLTATVSSGIVDKLAIGASNPSTLFAAGFFYPGPSGSAYSGALAISSDGGVTWSDKGRNWVGGNGQVFLSIGAIAIDPHNASRLWAMERETLRVSDDGGETWRTVHDWSKDGAFGYGVSIAINPQNPNDLVVFGQLGSRLYASSDAGSNWTSLGDTFDPALSIRAIAVDWRSQPRVIYLGTARGVYASTAGGQWTLVTGSAKFAVNAVTIAAPAGSTDRKTIIAATDSGVWELTPDPAGQFVSIYRFFNNQTGAHFYTASAAERAYVLATYPQFVDEGVAFWALGSPAAGTTPIFRFFNSRTGTHFYTADTAERDHIIATYKEFVYEGVAYYAFTESEPGTVGAYRFFNTSTGAHFYTTSPDEALYVQHHYPQFLPEGIRFGVYDAVPRQ